MKNFITFLPLYFLTVLMTAQPSIEWQRSLGGSGDDRAYSIDATNDGGYIVAATAGSIDGDLAGNTNDGFWLIKLNEMGDIQWQKVFYSDSIGSANAIRQTNDGGFIVTGVGTAIVAGSPVCCNYWVAKFNESGNLEWTKSLGGSADDKAYDIKQTIEGGYIIAGISYSLDGDVTNAHGDADCWIVKTSANGTIEWEKSLGGSEVDYAYSILQASDGSYTLAGRTGSTDGDVIDNSNAGACWVVNLDSIGTIQWQKVLHTGLNGVETGNSIQQTSDDGYIIAGYSVKQNSSDTDFWAIKLDDSLAIQWERSLGGTAFDYGYSICQTDDQAYVVTGVTRSNNGDVTGSHGERDAWIVKLSNAGEINWQRTIGGSYDDIAFSIQQTIDGGFTIAGLTGSNDGDVSGNHGLFDAWIVKLSSETNSVLDHSSNASGYFDIYPNPAQNKVFLNMPSEEPTFTIQLLDTQGRQITQQIITNGESLDVSTLSNGIYAIVATTLSGKIYSNKLTITK